MNKKGLLIGIGSIVFFAMIIYLSNLVTISAQECQVGSIISMVIHSPIRIKPETLLISKGDCVVWFNRAESAEEVKVTFEDGKKCMSVFTSLNGIWYR